MQFEIRRSAKVGQPYYWRIVAANQKVLAWSETYTNRADCIAAVELVRANAAAAPVHDYTKAA